MATSWHLDRQQGCRGGGGKDRHRRPDAKTPPSLAIAKGGRMGFEAKSRRERRSPEPGHLMGGEPGDEGGKAHDRRLEADEDRAPARGSARVRRRRRGRLDGSRSGPMPVEACPSGGQRR